MGPRVLDIDADPENLKCGKYPKRENLTYPKYQSKFA
jgi:hypothetical protein